MAGWMFHAFICSDHFFRVHFGRSGSFAIKLPLLPGSNFPHIFGMESPFTSSLPLGCEFVTFIIMPFVLAVLCKTFGCPFVAGYYMDSNGVVIFYRFALYSPADIRICSSAAGHHMPFATWACILSYPTIAAGLPLFLHH